MRAGEPVETVVRIKSCADVAVGKECVCRGPGWCFDRGQVDQSLMMIESERQCRQSLGECRDKGVAVPAVRGWNPTVTVLVVVGIVLVAAGAAYGAGYLSADLR